MHSIINIENMSSNPKFILVISLVVLSNYLLIVEGVDDIIENGNIEANADIRDDFLDESVSQSEESDYGRNLGLRGILLPSARFLQGYIPPKTTVNRVMNDTTDADLFADLDPIQYSEDYFGDSVKQEQLEQLFKELSELNYLENSKKEIKSPIPKMENKFKWLRFVPANRQLQQTCY